MERNQTNNQKIRWKKTGGGTFRMPGKIIKPGQIFLATLEEIPPAFRDTVIPVDDLPEDTSVPKVVENKEVEYSIQEREAKNWYDIVDRNGKVLNDKALRREAAEEMLKTLNA